MIRNTLVFLVYALSLFSCSSSSTQETQNTSGTRPSNSNPDPNETENTYTDWLIPVSDVLDGGPGRDGIPALENPDMVKAENASLLSDTDLVLGYKNGNDIRAYQHIVLDWHEIVNDNIGDASLAITYCPLTGTGIGWNRFIDGSDTTFGVSGLLYQTNLIPFDRATKSNWSQILGESVNGSLAGKDIDLITLVETDWKTWKAMFPNTIVISLNTGFSRTYGTYPYSDYKTNTNLFFFPTPKDTRLTLKDRVHAIVIGGFAKVYQFSDFQTAHVIKDTFRARNYLVVGNANFIASFELDASQDSMEFEYVFDGTSEVVLQDNQGRQYNIFGEAVSGSEHLKPSESFMGYWFSIPAFYNTVIYGD
ncbi:DUF3179 domain-containing protein [Kriegella aquimaris]|uniref:DUF3179 domain-containing protein n=1 Tax=Kriegella aquimaris TaxID=192904 RepID=A0A1G9MH27_9FLAO|nr:DUF3179 domain-containing protein [Kriegella aquimaris]SDL73572.1 Protein of unknown function [Kriegella aquimaris]